MAIYLSLYLDTSINFFLLQYPCAYFPYHMMSHLGVLQRHILKYINHWWFKYLVTLCNDVHRNFAYTMTKSEHFLPKL